MKRCYSLKRNKEFRHTYRVGKSAGCRSMVLVYVRRSSHGAQGVRIGFSVGKKLGNAVVRNRTKRRMREAVTPLIPLIAQGSKLIFIAKHPILDESFVELRSSMRYLLKKAGLLLQGGQDAGAERAIKPSGAAKADEGGSSADVSFGAEPQSRPKEQ